MISVQLHTHHHPSFPPFNAKQYTAHLNHPFVPAILRAKALARYASMDGFEGQFQNERLI
jgi:hypothetical protein